MPEVIKIQIQKPAKDQVHLWKLDLAAHHEFADMARQFLSSDERQRADRFYFARDAARFILTRSALRLLLANYLGCLAKELRFNYNAFGKPVLNNANGHDLFFNVSHSDDLALFVFSRYEETGVDVERHRAAFATLEIAKRFFYHDEYNTLAECSDEELVKRFFDCWTRKEAYIKAKGMGMSLSLDSFAVEAAPVARPKLLRSKHFPKDVERYSLISTQVADDYSGAIAVGASIARVEAQDVYLEKLMREAERNG